MAKKTSALKLYVKPQIGKPFGKWDFAWLTPSEIGAYTIKGYKRVKKVKLKDYRGFHYKVIQKDGSKCDMCFKNVDMYAAQAYQGHVTNPINICQDCLMEPIKEMEKLSNLQNS